jgi:hypothetical protein
MRTLDSVSLDAIFKAVSPESRALVFWVDDEKLVSRTFPLDMAAPLSLAGDDASPQSADRHLHFWDGNALAISRSVAESLAISDLNLRDDSLLTLLSDVVGRGIQLSERKLKVMFSPLERFSAIDAQPMGLAS